MTTPHFMAQPPAALPRRADRDRHAWVAPTVATALLTVLGPAALFLGGLSVMATDSCGPDDCSQALMTSLELIYGTLYIGGFLSFGVWIAAWVIPWTRRWAALRAWLAFASLLPSLIVLLLVFTLPAP
ncbi:hypothetical protein [Streptomyces sp. SID5910]|uniref:hypothetical protein n=1 Tax=Streptomyces sp. SID5910 TaxID=2690312 RepID=UPI001F4369F3|nr:hypothetical protein [Streptomyces sp. SID5910]